MVEKAWRIIGRPLMETILKNHANHPRVPQPLILHGPRGAGKTTLVLHRLLQDWNNGAHFTAYVDLAESIKPHHPTHGGSFPWCSWSTVVPPPCLSSLQSQLETALESMAEKAVSLGTIGSHHIFSVLNKWHAVSAALPKSPKKGSESAAWSRAVAARLGSGGEEAYVKEAMAALRLAKEVLGVRRGQRAEAMRHLNSVGGFSRSLANSATDWPCLLLELLSSAAELDYFQPKLVINNVEILKHAVLTDDSSVRGSLYHDSLIWRIIALGANERCLPVILVTSDSYYSYRSFIDFGFPDIFISRETFGWTSQEAKMHMVGDYFSESEWKVVAEVLGPSPRHLFELHALKQSNLYQKVMDSKDTTFEDIVDSYLAYLQVTVVNPAMDKALSILQKFASDARTGKVSKDRLRFGAPWKHPPLTDSLGMDSEWAKLQLMDFIQSLVKTEFGVNYLADCSLEIFDDPSAVALIEVGLLYAQRDPSFLRPISRGIQRCLVRWLVQQRIQMSSQRSLQYTWHRFLRGRSYRHLMLEVGYNKF